MALDLDILYKISIHIGDTVGTKCFVSKDRLIKITGAEINLIRSQIDAFHLSFYYGNLENQGLVFSIKTPIYPVPHMLPTLLVSL